MQTIHLPSAPVPTPSSGTPSLRAPAINASPPCCPNQQSPPPLSHFPHAYKIYLPFATAASLSCLQSCFYLPYSLCFHPALLPRPPSTSLSQRPPIRAAWSSRHIPSCQSHPLPALTHVYTPALLSLPLSPCPIPSQHSPPRVPWSSWWICPWHMRLTFVPYPPLCLPYFPLPKPLAVKTLHLE